MIELGGLSKSFGSVRAVDDVTAEVRAGRVTAFLGPNGAGKTTTLRMLCGLVRPDSGRVRVDGTDATTEPLAVRARLGVLPDSRGLYPRLTPREHIRYFGRLQGLEGSELESRIDALVDAFDLGEVADRRASGFSQGERTKVALARALVHDPGNVLLDEPTNGLDVMTTRATREWIRDLRKRGKCVVFSSHVMQEVSALCDTIVIVSHGRVVANGTADERLQQSGASTLEDAFVALAGSEAELA
jgi:sodium transport system ATP-binding protein